jgi:AbrB family looped-hinge helix DNA binding protein
METTATSKGQIVIPAEVRRRFGIRKGTRISVRVDEEEHAIVLKPITREFIESLRGIDRGRALLADLARERARDRDREDRPPKIT